MATIKVIAKVGDTHHPRLGLLKKGQEYEIDESDFGDEIFEKQNSSAAAQQENKKTGGSRKVDGVQLAAQKEE